MSKREELKRKLAASIVKKQELKNKLSKLGGKAEVLPALKEPPSIIVTREKLGENESIREEIKVIEAKLEEIRRELSKLPREKV